MESIGLLIVPYGIETEEAMQKQWELELLIVPYGIETRYFPERNKNSVSF